MRFGECVPEGLLCVFVVLLGVLVITPEPTRYGNNAVLYNKAFNQCVGMLVNIPRNVSTVEDDNTSDILSQCRIAADESSNCVYNGKECI